MTDENDPAVSQEGAGDGAATVADPQATEEVAESPEESGEGAGSPQEDQEKADEFEITVAGQELPPEPKEAAQPWVKELRKKYREAEARAAALERKLQAQGQSAQAADPGPKPTLESCGFDVEEYDKKKDAWTEATKRKQAAEDQTKREAQSLQESYATSKAEISKKVPNYAELETLVSSALTIDRQAALISSGVNVPLVVCALAKYPKLLEELAKEPNRDRFIARLAKLEGDSTMKKKSQVPPPEKPVSGTGAVSGGKDSTLERLRAQADKTGDRTAVVEYLRKKRKA